MIYAEDLRGGFGVGGKKKGIKFGPLKFNIDSFSAQGLDSR